jgi:methionyl-tRNA formyltransferase
MKIFLLIGNQSHHKALAVKINSRFSVHTVVVEARNSARKLSAMKVLSRVVDLLLFRKIFIAWKNMLHFYETRFSEYPPTSLFKTVNINSEEVYCLITTEAPDLIIVSGTKLLGKKLLTFKPSIGIVNLHTGLSPYMNGGPNCTNWCIALNQIHLIGNTVMWIDEGIDSGDIITTETIKPTGEEDLTELYLLVINHAHELYIRAISHILIGHNPKIAQRTIATGRTFYTKEWTNRRKFDLIKNFSRFKAIVQSQEYAEKKARVVTIALPVKH